MRDKGMSTVVATVSMILIAVASVTILWAGISPLINKAILIDDVNVRFTIDRSGSYTVYDPANHRLRVQVRRRTDEAEVVALKFLIESDGDSQAFRTSDVPSPNAAKVLILAVGFLDHIDAVKLVPVYLVNGKEIEGSTYFLDERIPHRENALDEAEGTDGVELSEGLVFYYPFDEEPDTSLGEGNKQIFDYSGYSHTGTLGGDVYFTANGKVGGAYVFDGNADYISLLTAPSGDGLFTANKTIAFWAKPECKIDSSVFGSHENYAITFYDICGTVPILPYSDSLIVYYLRGDQVSSDLHFGSTPIEEGTWHHYLTTWAVNGNDVKVRLYIDSVFSEQREEIGSGYGAIDPNFYLGTSADQSGSPIDEASYSGAMDEFRIYGRILRDEEIIQLYQIGING